MQNNWICLNWLDVLIGKKLLIIFPILTWPGKLWAKYCFVFWDILNFLSKELKAFWPMREWYDRRSFCKLRTVMTVVDQYFKDCLPWCIPIYYIQGTWLNVKIYSLRQTLYSSSLVMSIGHSERVLYRQCVTVYSSMLAIVT